MKRFWGFVSAATLAVASLPAAPALASTASNYAKSSCTDRIRRDYDASTRNVNVSESGYDRFNVTGEARRNGEAANFNCRTDRGSVKSLNVQSWHKSSGGGGDAVAAVGIAVGLAAIIAAASSKKKHNEDYDRYGRQDYDRGNNGYSANNGYYNNDSYSPGSGMTCYRAQRACFDNYNNYNPRWTQREFGY
jgi:hypothetical protein